MRFRVFGRGWGSCFASWGCGNRVVGSSFALGGRGSLCFGSSLAFIDWAMLFWFWFWIGSVWSRLSWFRFCHGSGLSRLSWFWICLGSGWVRLSRFWWFRGLCFPCAGLCGRWRWRFCGNRNGVSSLSAARNRRRTQGVDSVAPPSLGFCRLDVNENFIIDRLLEVRCMICEIRWNSLFPAGRISGCS